jgi:PAS domain S-box-containing protein
MHNLTSEYASPLREQEAFRVMFDQAGFGVAQLSVQGEWLAVNQALCDILGYSRESLLSKTLQEITRFDVVHREIANCNRMLAGEVPSFSVHKRHLRGDGRVAWLKVTVTLVRDNLTGPNSYLAIIEDLTSQRKQVQQVMIEGDRRFRILADNISDVFFTLDHDLTCTYWNKAAESLTGFPFEEALGKGINEIFSHGDDVPSPEETYREVLTIQQARSFTVPCAIGSKDFLFDITAFPAREGVYVVARDIAGREKAQEALQRLAAIVQFNDDAILSVSRDSRISSWNRGAERLYGYSAAEVLEKNFSYLVSPTFREEAQALCRGALEGMSVVGYETTHRRKDGTQVSVAVSMSPIRDAKGSIVGISSIARDITQHKLTEAALKRQVAFDELMTGILTRFTTRAASEVDDSVIYALQETAEFIGVDHAHVIVFSADRTTWSATHEWCGNGVERQFSHYQKVPVGSVPWSESKILGGEVIRIDHMRDYPPEAKEERQLTCFALQDGRRRYCHGTGAQTRRGGLTQLTGEVLQGL